jgi:hypothetical protein
LAESGYVEPTRFAHFFAGVRQYASAVRLGAIDATLTGTPVQANPPESFSLVKVSNTTITMATDQRGDAY